MKNLKNIFTAAVIATATLCVADVVTPQKAQAAGCYPPLAANVIANMMRGGATSYQAQQAATNRGYLDSDWCVMETVGYMRGYPYIYGDIVR